MDDAEHAIAAAISHEVAAPDGRTLRVYEAGDPSGAPVVVHHGTPGSGLLAEAWSRDARDRGIRLIGFDRAGYGGSSRLPGRDVAAVAADVVAIADGLGLQRFRTWGVSGGGPHALACAALLPDRVVAAATIASVAPHDVADLDWTGGMGEANVMEFDAAAAGEEPLRAFLAAASAEMLKGGPDGLADGLATILPPVDVAALSGGFAGFMYAWMAAGLQTVDGWVDDDLAFVNPWGFDLRDVRVPVLILQGQLDLMVPVAHGQWLAGHVPGAESWLAEADGHVSMVAHLGRMHGWLLEH
jgi:pimeloyl-ACP methyl ester carboxylesterase